MHRSKEFANGKMAAVVVAMFLLATQMLAPQAFAQSTSQSAAQQDAQAIAQQKFMVPEAPPSADKSALVDDPALPSAANAAMNTVDARHIREHVKFLSSDLLEGRGTGQRGGDIAAEYIATQFAQYGLQPAGENGSFLQPVPLVGVDTQPSSTFIFKTPTGDMPLKFADDYVVNNEKLTPVAEVHADVVFVGYGIQAPEYGWDDFKGVDVRGKVLLMLVNEPSSDDPKFFKGPALTYYGRWTYKYEHGAKLGAVGVILIHRTDMASYGWEVVRNSNTGEVSFLRDGQPHPQAAGWIQLEVARKLFAANGLDLEQMFKAAQSRDFKPVLLKTTLDAHIVAKVRDVHSANVVAMLPGSDPRFRDQAIIYSAHYDHLGIRPGQPGDNIYNGADDNATGCGILLELARAYAASGVKPKRSIIFASVTAEEQGLLGSAYLGLHPPVAAGKISLGLNYDDVAPLGEPQEVEVSGAERNDFYPQVEQAAKVFNMEIKPDAFPQAGYYYRSDHFSFSRVGIPAFSISQGRKFAGHDASWGEQQAKDYTARHYHQPSDEYDPAAPYAGLAKMAKFGFDLGWRAASSSSLTNWEPGDEFEPARKQSQR